MKRLALLALFALAACGPSTTLPPLPTPGPDMCIAYGPFEYSKAAALVELVATLRIHNTNELTFYDKCIAGKQSQRPGGAR